MLMSICRRRILVGNSYKFQLQNALSPPTITLRSSQFSELSTQAAACPSNAQAVTSLLRNHGFSNTQISKLVQIHPRLLSADPKQTRLPKTEVISSTGIPSADLPAISLRGTLLNRSLEKALHPGYNFPKTELLSDEIVGESVNRDSKILGRGVGGSVALNLEVLMVLGVSQPLISFLLSNSPNFACENHVKSKICVEDVTKMGFDPLKHILIDAAQVKCGLRNATWDHRMEIYSSWGLSDEELLLAFKNHLVFSYNSKPTINCNPEGTRFRKQRRGRTKGIAHRGNHISFGNYALQALEAGWITSRQIEAGRRAIIRNVPRGGKLWVRVFADKPVTIRPTETRMGRGKGSPAFLVAVVQLGRILYEMSGVTESTARKAISIASSKMPIQTQFIMSA